MITPHFPPDSSAGSHRVRLLAPHLAAYGWSPTVLTVDPSFYDGLLDEGLASLVPRSLRVERSSAIPSNISRIFGVGDLGLRSFGGLHSRAVELLSRERYDAVYITVYPTYTALLGPLLKRRFRIPFVLDYQDPWVGSWGNVVGGGQDGAVDARSRMSRLIAMRLEPFAVRAADAITAVSRKTADDVLARIPITRPIPVLEIPVGGDENDFALVKSRHTGNPIFDPSDGYFHLSCVGTLLPLGLDTLLAFLSAVASVRDTALELYKRLRVHFVGTSNARTSENIERVMPHARRMGLDDVIREQAMRIDYPDAVNVQIQSSAILLLGSSEHHYTASRLYPALLARRPLLALYHHHSSVSRILSEHADARIHLVRFGDEDPATAHVGRIAEHLSALISDSVPKRQLEPMDYSLSARHLAGMLAGLLDNVAAPMNPSN